jgi:hypothetical protein
MTFMNSDEVDHAIDVIAHHAPEFSPYAKYLGDWRDVINNHSDGWAYWKAGRNSASKLVTLVQSVIDVLAMRSRAEMPTEKDFLKALTPIKSMATKHNLTAPTLDKAAAPAMGS